MKDRYVNKNRTQEIFLSDPNDAMWGDTHESLIDDGWILSDDPLRLSNEDCSMCEGGKVLSTLKNIFPVFYAKCQHCDGTGKKLS